MKKKNQKSNQDSKNESQKPKESKLDKCFKTITFMNGLPGEGKTTKLLAIAKKDKYRDLCINLVNRHQKIEGIKYTPGFFKARNLKPIHAIHLPKYTPYLDYKILHLFHYEHPKHVQHILIDEVEKCPVNYLIQICTMIRHFYPKIPFILAGVVLDDHNRVFKTSRFLLDHCKSWNVDSLCHFCHRPAVYMLDVWHHKKTTYAQINQIEDRKKRKYVKHHLIRYHVCKHHYNHPPVKKL